MNPARGEIWFAELDPTTGREQAGRRPVLVVSVDRYNAGGAELVIAVPLTSRLRSLPYHVIIEPPEGGLTSRSSILCDAVRSISKSRLKGQTGVVSRATMAAVEERLRLILRL